MVCVCSNNLAHLALLTSLVTTYGPGRLPDRVRGADDLRRAHKDPVLALHGVHGQGFTPASIVIGLTAAYALVYALAALVWVWR